MRLPPVLLIICAALPALDVDAKADWVDGAYKATWNNQTLGDVLELIRRESDRPLERSPGIAQAINRRVVVIDAKKQTLRKALESLEFAAGIRFQAGSLRLVVRTAEEENERQRRIITIQPQQWGSRLRVPDFPGPYLGNTSEIVTAPKSQLGPTPGSSADSGDASGWFFEQLQQRAEPMRGDGALRIAATPVEEQAIRQRLAAQLAITTRSCSWIATTGTLPADQPLPAGIVGAEAGHALAARLKNPRELRLRGLAGQMVHAQALGVRSQVDDAQVVSSQLDPTITPRQSGRACTVRAMPGQSGILLSWRLQWVDPLPDTPRVVRDLPRSGSTLASLQNTEGKTEGDVTAVPQHRGSTVTIDLAAEWNWDQAGDVMLPPQSAFVAIAPHPDGRAVIVLEATP